MAKLTEIELAFNTAKKFELKMILLYCVSNYLCKKIQILT